jgi:prophage regulatory protein
MTNTTQKIVRMDELITILGLSRATVNRYRKAGNFPKPIELGPHSIGFKREEIDAWIASRPTKAYFEDSLDLSCNE